MARPYDAHRPHPRRDATQHGHPVGRVGKHPREACSEGVPAGAGSPAGAAGSRSPAVPAACRRPPEAGRGGGRAPDQSLGFGYLLKDRVFDVDDFLDALRRVGSGGSALDPEVVAQLITPGRDDGLALLTPRERQVLVLMAEGRTNLGIARRLWLSARTIETHVGTIIAKRGLPDSEEEHRRVLAVLASLGHRLP